VAARIGFIESCGMGVGTCPIRIKHIARNMPGIQCAAMLRLAVLDPPPIYASLNRPSPFYALRSAITTNAVIRLHRHGGPEWLKLDELLAGAAAARYVERERACFKETNIFPIMHVAAMKGEIVDRYPWVTAMPAVWRANSARAAPI
jgi:hypothetical protein